jgi:AraC family transcriptional regulator
MAWVVRYGFSRDDSFISLDATLAGRLEPIAACVKSAAGHRDRVPESARQEGSHRRAGCSAAGIRHLRAAFKNPFCMQNYRNVQNNRTLCACHGPILHSKLLDHRERVRRVGPLAGMKVIDAALKYGYESPTAFYRAFQGVHGVTPSAAREEGAQLKAFPRISFTISIKGEAEMNYRIEKKDAFKIVGVKEHFDMSLEESFRNVPMFWQKTVQSGAVPAILAAMDREPYGLLGVSTCMNGRDFDYYIAVASSRPAKEGMAEYEVPACTWAVFDCVGPMPNALQDLQKRIVTEWLPSSGYEYADAPDIEVYPEGNQESADYRCQAWLPVTKKG